MDRAILRILIGQIPRDSRSEPSRMFARNHTLARPQTYVIAGRQDTASPQCPHSPGIVSFLVLMDYFTGRMYRIKP